MQYDFQRIEKSIQDFYKKELPWRLEEEETDGVFYSLGMFPYPSGRLHMGHLRVYSISDIQARFHRLCGEKVLHPIGWDSFGLPAENAAIQRRIRPDLWTDQNIQEMKEQFDLLGFSFDWSREVQTSHPDYYRWTQWIFLKLYEKGLAYKKPALVNWCPVDQTVLANEQVIQGRCWRDGALVEKKEVDQWFFRLSDFAPELWDRLDILKDWQVESLAVQRNWIGKQEGYEVDFPFQDSLLTAFTTRPDTLWGVCAVVLAPEHPLARSLAQENASLAAYLEQAFQKSELDRQKDQEKTGHNTGFLTQNPLTQENIPIFVADYVLADYGTGVLMCVPAHDERDYEFAQRMGLEVRPVLKPEEGYWPFEKKPFLEKKGRWCDLGMPYDGQKVESSWGEVVSWMEKQFPLRKKVLFRLKDWSVGRQRYWGCPIPLIFCDHCGIVPVPEKDLPVRLPHEELEAFWKQENPPLPRLSQFESFWKTMCPSCGREARRETDTLDTFLCSSWYLFRYMDPHNQQQAFSLEKARQCLPINFYVGALEHAALHMIYLRFLSSFFYREGLIPTPEPVQAFFTNGFVKKDGSKMSKSKGNVVEPSDLVKRYGADTARLYIMSDTPASFDLDWSDDGVEAKFRFVSQLYGQLEAWLSGFPQCKVVDFEKASISLKNDLVKFYERLNSIKLDLKRFSFHTCVARFHEMSRMLKNWLTREIDEGEKGLLRKAIQDFLVAFSCFCPHLSESLLFRHYNLRPADCFWPSFPDGLRVSASVQINILVNGKRVKNLVVPSGLSQGEVEALAKEDPFVKKKLQGALRIQKVIFVPDRILNFVL